MPVDFVHVPQLPLDRLEPVIGPERMQQLERGAAGARALLDGRTLWNVNSTATGGGVAEMLQVLVGYALGAGIDVRWAVIGGDAEFFAITKRIHNRIHGFAGDDGALGEAEAAHYAEVTSANGTDLLEHVRRGDVVLLHDPQTAGLVPALASAGARVIWRCHIGADRGNDYTDEAWRFLRPHVEAAERLVFSRPQHVPAWVPQSVAAVIPPSIDPFSPKNQELDDETVAAVLAQVGIGSATGTGSYTRRDGSTAVITGRAEVVGGDDVLDRNLPAVVQVSRWDRLKDMLGVMVGFERHVAGRVPAVLLLVGPDVRGVTDDPEGQAVLEECVAAWKSLDGEAQRHIRLVTLPMDDVDDNAAMVNALQRHATVAVQKSLAEGFGLTVAEAMWKGNPVVASAVGGIVDQVVPGTGVLLDDPTDLDVFGTELRRLLDDRDEARRIGERAREHVRRHFVGDRHLMRYVELLRDVLA